MTEISDELALILEKEIYNYPSLFHRGGDVLEFLFCTIGTGYEWLDGEIKYPYEEERPDIYQSFDAYLNYFHNENKNDPWTIKHAAGSFARDLAIRQTAKLRSKDKRCSHRQIYPLCEYSLINKVPLNCKPIWYEAYKIVKEMIEWYPDYNEYEGWKEEDFSIEGMDK